MFSKHSHEENVEREHRLERPKVPKGARLADNTKAA